MDIMVQPAGVGSWYLPGAYAAIGATAVSAASLILLHALSPEFAPSWRMVSEYANGRFPWLLTVVFAAWAISSFALVAALWPLFGSAPGRVGLLFLTLAGIGQIMGGMFDINHRLHGPAAMIGIPSLCVAALLLTNMMSRRPDLQAPPTWSAHLPWISFALMIGTFVLFFTSLRAAGVDMSAQSGPLSELPAGAAGYMGWANRLLFVASYLWLVLASLAVVRARSG